MRVYDRERGAALASTEVCFHQVSLSDHSLSYIIMKSATMSSCGQIRLELRLHDSCVRFNCPQQSELQLQGVRHLRDTQGILSYFNTKLTATNAE